MRPLRFLRRSSALPLCALLATAAFAQEPGGDPPVDVEQELDRLMGADDPQERMLELFREVELKLRAIDDLLFEAASGEADLLEDLDSGLADLLDETRDSSRNAVEGIDEILKIAESMSNQSSGQGQGQGQSGQGQQGQGDPSESPLDGRGQESQRGREQSSDAPRPELEQGGQQPGEQPQAGEGSLPTGAEDSDADPTSQEGQESTPGETGPGAPPPVAGEWGELPPRVQQIFRNRTADDVPVKYRDWIDSYYRRLSTEGR